MRFQKQKDRAFSGGLEATYIDVPESTEPASPATDTLRLFATDVNGYSFLSFKDATGMVRAFVRDSVIVGYNNTGSTIALGRIVYASGSFSGAPTIALAKADSSATMPAIGVTIQTIADGTYGRIMQVGLLEDVNTSTYSVADVLYVSAVTAGLPSITRPTYPNHSQEIGTVIVDDPTVGAIQIVARAITTQPAGDDEIVPLGDGAEAELIWQTTDANANALILALPEGDATDVPVFIVGDKSIKSTDLGLFDGITEPMSVVVDDDADSYVGVGFISDDNPGIIMGGSAAPANSAKNPTIDAPADWLPVKIGATTYYAPLYAAS
jgi:hypothetical protein